MFVRKHAVRDVAYLTLVENLWDPAKKRYTQNRIASLGKVADLIYRNHRIEQIVTALDSFCAKQGVATIGDGIILKNLSRNEDAISSSFDFGIHRLAAWVLRELGLSQTIVSLPPTPGVRIAKEKLGAAVEALIAYRLLPRTDASELSTFHWYTNGLYVPEKKPLNLMDFYRTLDVLIANKDAIETAYYEKNKTLFNGKLDLVLFDTTSVYYWGSQENGKEEDLLQYGFSKDGKGNLKQLIVGVLMTNDGIPIAHEVFPGNTSDVTSFHRIITFIKEKYKIEKIILIADRGMVSEQNLLTLEQSGFSYVVGIRMRQMSNELKQKLLVPLDEQSLQNETDYMDKAADNLYVREFPVSAFSDKEIQEYFLKKIKQGKIATTTFDEKDLIASVRKRRFFICLNPSVKEATKKKREHFTRIIERKIKTTPTKEWIVKNGYKKYLTFEKGLSPTIDYERLRDEAHYDGKWIVMTNEKTISSYTAGIYYKQLQTIERGFRDLKSLITVQPIFHWTERRIRGHIFTCFLALIIKWYICRMINRYSQEDGRAFLAEVANLKAVCVDPTTSLYLRTEITKQLGEGFAKLGMKPPEKVLFDGRRKQKPHQPHAGGRPRISTMTSQLHLPTDSV